MNAIGINTIDIDYQRLVILENEASHKFNEYTNFLKNTPELEAKVYEMLKEAGGFYRKLIRAKIELENRYKIDLSTPLGDRKIAEVFVEEFMRVEGHEFN